VSIEVDALEWTGDNLKKIQAFTGEDKFVELVEPPGEYSATVFDELHTAWISLRTGDYVIKGIRGEFYPCERSVFEVTYESIAS
jgi:hypothetical protein